MIVSSVGANPDARATTLSAFTCVQRACGRRGPGERARLDRRTAGRTHNDAGTDRFTLGDSVSRGRVPRDDVAAVLAAALDSPNTIGKTEKLVGGDTPITEAVTAI